MPRADENELAWAASVLRGPDPVAAAYRVLEEAAARHGLHDAWLVLHPAGVASQVFRLGRRPLTGADVRGLAARPTGLYGEPAIDPVTGALLGGLCEAAFSIRTSAADAFLDGPTGLLSRRAVDASLARAAACGSRHRWSTTAVLVTTSARAGGGQWLALASALRQAVRSGDEVGVASPGTALALLGNAGADAVRPFLARVRAALSAAGWDAVDLLAATATTPQESVDPDELIRLATDRLLELGAEHEVGPSRDELDLELELRLLPAVASVGVEQNGKGPKLTVVRIGDAVTAADVDAAVRRHHPDMAVQVVAAAPVASPGQLPDRDGVSPGHGVSTDGAGPDHRTPDRGATAPPPAAGTEVIRSAMAPGGSEDPGDPARVMLVGATFDADRGVSEVTLSSRGSRGTGRVPAGPLVGGAQATLVALGALGREVPFYLVSAERVRSLPNEPAVVVLAPRQDPGGGTEERSRGEAGGAAGGAGERIGVAGAPTDVEAASRAALAALNRFLASPHGAA